MASVNQEGSWSQKMTAGTAACLTAAVGGKGEIDAFKSHLLAPEILGAGLYF